MMEISFLILVVIFTAFMLWLGTLILGKAGIDKRWILCLLIPFVNIIAVWAFAFINWPKLKDSVEQNIN